MRGDCCCSAGSVYVYEYALCMCICAATAAARQVARYDDCIHACLLPPTSYLLTSSPPHLLTFYTPTYSHICILTHMQITRRKTSAPSYLLTYLLTYLPTYLLTHVDHAEEDIRSFFRINYAPVQVSISYMYTRRPYACTLVHVHTTINYAPVQVSLVSMRAQHGLHSMVFTARPC